MTRLGILVLALLLGLSSGACLVRTGPGHRREAVHSGKHRHEHCHHRGKHGKQQCHSHPHTHPHH